MMRSSFSNIANLAEVYSQQNDFNMRAARSHSASRVAGQKASRPIRDVVAETRALVVSGAGGLLDQRKTLSRGDLILLAVTTLLRPLLVVLALLVLLLASQDGRKLETRCMVFVAQIGGGGLIKGVGDVFLSPFADEDGGTNAATCVKVFCGVAHSQTPRNSSSY